MTDNPPSFEPAKRRPRPGTDGAKVIRGREAKRIARSERQPRTEPREEVRREAPRPTRREPVPELRKSRERAVPPRQVDRTQVSPTVPRDNRNRTAQPARRQPLGLPMDETAVRQATPPQRQVQRAPSSGSGAYQPGQPGPAGGGPGGYGGGYPGDPSRPPRRRRKRRGLKIFLSLFLVVVLAITGWGLYLVKVGNDNLDHVDALSGRANTPGRTVLFVGNDSRQGDVIGDGVEGSRADTIMILHLPESGAPALISIPRDTYVDIPGYRSHKVNSAYAWGGPPLLVQTVENLTGLTIDHYVEISMGGVSSMVDAVGGVELCLDYDVDDADSQLVWEAGCHVADGKTALAFSRMRKSDPLGDIGRTARQRQVVSQVIKKAASPSTIVNPRRQKELVEALTSVLVTDTETGLVDLGRTAMGLRSAMGDGGVIGAPPISSFNYHPGNAGSTVQLDPNRIEQFWVDLANGDLTQADAEVSLP